MADTKQTIDIIFNGIDRTASAVSSVVSGVENSANKLKSLADPVANVTTGILKFEAAMLASGAALTLFAVKTAGDFDAAFREITTIIDAPADKLAEFKQDILDYASTSTQSLEQITGAVYDAISSDVAYTDSLAMVKQAEQLAVASKAELGESLKVLVSSLNAYGAGADQAQKFSDILFKTVEKGQTTLPELAASLAQVTGLAANAGIPFETLTASIAALTATGAPTSQAITSIKAAISNIVKPSKEASDTAAELGIQFNASALQSKGLEGVLLDVAKATGGNVETMAKLFGSTEALNAVLSLTGTGAEKFKSALEEIRNSAGATKTAFDEMVEALEFGNQRIQNALKVMLEGIGRPLLDEFGGIQNAIAAIFKAIGASVNEGELGEFVQQLEGLAGDAQRTLEAIAKNLPEALASADFSEFIKGIEVVKEAIMQVFDGADLTTAEGLKHAIEVVGSGFLTLSQFVGSTIKAIGPFVELLADVAKFMAELDPEFVKLAGAIGGIAIIAAPVLTAIISLSGALGTIATATIGAGAAFAAVAASPLAVALALTALAAAAYAAGTEINNLTAYGREMTQLNGEIAESEKTRADLHGEVAKRLAELSKQTGLNIKDMDEFNRLEKEGIIIFDEASGKWVKVGESIGQSTGKLMEHNVQMLESAKNARLAGEKQTELADAVKSTADNFDLTISAADNAGKAFKRTASGSIDLNARMAELTGKDAALPKAESAMNSAAEKAEKLKDKMLELASNEKIKAMELTVDLKIAEAEAGAKAFASLMETISKSVENTGQTLLGMTGQLDTIFRGPSSSAQKIIQGQIDAESRRRDSLIKAQVDLLKLQADSLKIRNDRMRRGDALIKIDTNGLEPALEMVIWNLLDKVRIRATEEASEFLIALNPGAE